MGAADRQERGLGIAVGLIVLLLVAAGLVNLFDDDGDTSAPEVVASDGADPTQDPLLGGDATAQPPPAVSAPRGRIFDRGRFLVAYYGAGGTGALGVLGETDPDTMHRRLMRAARPFARPGRPVQPVYELIVTIADRTPGPDGDYNHDVPRAVVERYIRAAHRNDALLLLDLQTGRSRFVDVAKRWAWALRDPYVGLALDPEWRMAKDEVPGTVIGSVGAEEVNKTSYWLTRLQLRHGLPEKLFVLHQFRTDMIRDPADINPRPRLAMVQHVDGFGTPSQKIDTFRAVARPRQFEMGFKLFYDEDTRLMSARDVHRISPAVRFVSFQ